MSNIRQLPPLDPDALAADVERFRRNLGSMIEHGKLMAKMKRAWYLAYVAEGFTPKEALDLIRGA